MVYCCVPLCKSERGRTRDVSFHEFPSQISQRELWLKNIDRKNWAPSDRSVVCSLHFRKEDFRAGLKTKQLVEGVIPSIFDKFPIELQAKCPKRKPPAARSSITSTKVKTAKLSCKTDQKFSVEDQANASSQLADNFIVPDLKDSTTSFTLTLAENSCSKDFTTSFTSAPAENSCSKDITTSFISTPAENSHSKDFTTSFISTPAKNSRSKDFTTSFTSTPAENSHSKDITTSFISTPAENSCSEDFSTNFTSTPAENSHSNDFTTSFTSTLVENSNPCFEHTEQSNALLDRNQEIKDTDIVVVNIKYEADSSDCTERAAPIFKECVKKKVGRRPIPRDILKSNLKVERIKTKRLKTQVIMLKDKLLNAKKKCSKSKCLCPYSKNLCKMVSDKQDNVNSAEFLINQIEIYGSKANKWSERTIRECVILRAISSKSYEYIRKRGLFKLPSRMTLQRYVGFVEGESVCTSLIKQRLTMESTKLNTSEKNGCLIFDETPIGQQAKDTKCSQRVDLDNGNGSSTHILANRLLCFVFSSLSTFPRIPVAYYFIKQLKSQELCKLILRVIHDVEQCGFTITSVMCDNSRVNKDALKFMCPEQKLQPEIQHPEDSKRSLSLNLDCAHMIKDVCSLFLNEK